MKTVSFYEFCKLPDGTIFSYVWDGGVFSLYRRGAVIFENGDAVDYFQRSLLAIQGNSGGIEIESIESRWGAYDYDQLYVVYDEMEIKAMVGSLVS